MKLFIDPDSMKALYASSPDSLKALMNAWADGLNFYLYKNPTVTPKVIKKFEPWMALTFSEGSIGGDIERVNLRDLQAFYGGARDTTKALTELERRIPARAHGLERHRHRAIDHGDEARDAARQPAHVVLLPLGSAGHERSGPQRVRCRHVGPVLRVSGLQRSTRLDAHVERGGQHR
jgi:acyl-homoserine lactone acylase PvdQ